MAVERKLMTAEELLRLPSGMGVRHELIDGELRTMAPPGGEHGQSGGWAHYHLAHVVRSDKLGEICMAETGFLLRSDPDRVRAPDFAYIRAERVPVEGLPAGYIPFAPDLVLEVVSPNDTAAEIREKVQDWLGFGTRAVWVLYRGPRLDVHVPGNTMRTYGAEDEVDGGEVLPGFRMRVAELVRP
jgi:Uma2 family endonuclease